MHPLMAMQEVGAQLVVALRLNTHPLAHLPLAVTIAGQQRSYCFPNAAWRWVSGQGAVDAAAFLARHLQQQWRHLLSEEQLQLLQTSMTAQLALLRSIRADLPGKRHLQRAYARALPNRIALLDGTWLVEEQQFEPLPYQHEDMVFESLQVTYAGIQEATGEEMQQAHALLEQWLSEPDEKAWLLRYLGRTLSPQQDACKTAVIHCDTLGDHQAGSRGKTTLQYMLECVGLCSPLPGDTLSIGRSHSYMRSRMAATHPPLLQAFDELPGQQQQLDLAAVKVLTSGKPPSPGLVIACNPQNLPCLDALCSSDPAAFERLVFLPARPLLQCRGNVHAAIEKLVPAFAKILLDQHHNYCQQGLLQIPHSMQAHKELLKRYSCLSRFKPGHVKLAAAWLDKNMALDTPAEQMKDKFVK